MKKKILLSFILMCISIFALGMLSVSAETHGDLTYKIENDEVTITSCSTWATEVVIPEEIGGKKVTSIRDMAFCYNSSLTSVTIPDSVTSIGNSAFYECYGLTSVTIGNGVTSIGNKAFYACTGLTSVTIGNGVTSIGEQAFQSCGGLTIVTIPDSVTNIGGHAFLRCSGLTSITIPDSVTSIGDGAFSSCRGLTSVTIGNSVTSIGEYAFSSCGGLTSVTIGSSVTNIGDYAFAYCSSLTSITLPDSVTSIGNWAFSDCGGLTSVTIGNSVTSIGSRAFYYCSSLANVYISDLKAYLNIDFGSSYSVPTFYAKKLYLNNALLTDVSIPTGLEIIPSYAFIGKDCITSVTIPNSVTSIGNYVFSGCSSLTSINIPDSITNIGNSAFNGCTNLTDVYINDLKTYFNIDFDNISSAPTYYAKNLYLNNELLTNVIIPNGVETIPIGAFYENTNIKSVTIPDSVTSIGGSAFSGCNSLTSVIIGNGVTSIGNYAFSDCTSLTDVTIPKGVTQIGKYTFDGCTALVNITIPDSITSIGYGAFNDCKHLTNVYINDLKAYMNIKFDVSYYGTITVPTYYAHNLYLNNELLTEVVIPNRVEKIPMYAFYYNTNITSVTIPDSVTSIDSYAFYYTDITNVTIPNSVTSIGYEAFYYCNNLKNVYYNGTEEEWNKISIGSYNSYLTDANRIYFAYLTLIDENGKELSKTKQSINSYIDISDFEEKTEQVLHFYTDKECTNEFDLKTPITENTTLYLKYVTNQYTYKFLDEDGTVLKEETVDYGTTIVPPENPSKQNTKQYTYTFDIWSGYTEGMTVTGNVTFTAQYTETVNQYTYKFLDNDNKVLKETTVDYGTVITPPEAPADKDPYTFDYWDGYTSGAELTDNVEFKAVYKYKTYKITAEGLNEPLNVTYNSNYIVTPQSKDGYNFVGYFTEADGKGTQITNGKGESIKAYDVVGDLSIYPYFWATHFNKVELQGSTTAMPGDTIKQNAIFATDKEAMYVTATIKYPEYLNFKSISGGDFAEAEKDKETVKDGYKYLDITCLYDYNGGNMPINQNLIPFEITFEVATDAPIENANISIENVTLIGNGEYSITDFTNNIVEITPKLAESVSITGNNSIDRITKYTATVSPDYTTNKAVNWSIDNEEIATISADGMLTPIKNGTVKVTATAQDGSGKFDTKTVNVTAYATITSLECNGIAVEIVPDKYEYTIYVKNDTAKISLTPTFTGGTLKLNGSGIWISGKTKEVDLTDKEITVTLNRNNVTDMTDNAYTIKIIKFEGTKTNVSEAGKAFTVKPINVDKGNTVILALYDGDTFVEMQSAIYDGEDIPFKTTESYGNAKVMVWSSIGSMTPICEAEIVK